MLLSIASTACLTAALLQSSAVPQIEGPAQSAPAPPVRLGPESVLSSPTYEPGVSIEDLLARPLVVNGERIPEQEIRRYLAYGVGSKTLDSLKYQVIIDHELECRAAVGEDLSKYMVREVDFEEEVARQRDAFLLDYPTLDFEREVARALGHVDLWKHSLLQTMTFDLIFLQDDPDLWPPITVAAIIDESGGDFFVIDAKEVYQLRLQEKEEKGLDKLPPWPSMYLDMVLRPMVLDSMHKFAQIEYLPERLPEGAIMTVDGVPILIDEVFEIIRPHLTWLEVAEARHFLAAVALLEADLAQKGALLDRATYEQMWIEEDYERQREVRKWQIKADLDKEGVTDEAERETAIEERIVGWTPEPRDLNRVMFDRQMLAIAGHFHFRSMYSYFEHKRLTASYAQLIAEELEDDAQLRSHLPRTNMVTSAPKNNVEVILCTAFDFHSFRWMEGDAWEQALAKAELLKGQIDKGGDWSKLLELHSDFWDPPQPDKSKAKPIFSFKFKGAWGPQTRNQLLMMMEESELTTWLYGKSVADYAFFEQKVGTVEGPFKGPYGYYLTRVSGRSPATRPLNIHMPRHRTLIQEYYLRNRFNEYSRDVIDGGEVVGR